MSGFFISRDIAARHEKQKSAPGWTSFVRPAVVGSSQIGELVMVKRQMELSLGTAAQQPRPAKPDDARWWFARMYQAVEDAVMPADLRESAPASRWPARLAGAPETLGLNRKMVLIWKS
jgi:hypothetical protein